MVTASGKVRGDDDFIFYNNPRSSDGSVERQADARAAGGANDNQVVLIDLPRVPAEIAKIVFTATIDQGEKRGQSFSQVFSPYIRVADAASRQEIARFDLPTGDSREVAMIFGEVYRHQGDWKFRAIGQGFVGGLAALATSMGVDVASEAPAPPPPPAPPPIQA